MKDNLYILKEINSQRMHNVIYTMNCSVSNAGLQTDYLFYFYNITSVTIYLVINELWYLYNYFCPYRSKFKSTAVARTYMKQLSAISTDQQRTNFKKRTLLCITCELHSCEEP